VIRAIRRQLRSIAYYSARREPSRWTRLVDAALVAAPLLALFLAVITHLVPPRGPRATSIVGDLLPVENGAISARIVNGKDAGKSPLLLIGDFDLALTVRPLGWPLESGDEITKATLTIRWLHSQQLSALNAEAQTAVAGALQAQGHASYARALAEGASERTLDTSRLVGNALVWWVGLTILLPLLIQLLRLLAWMVGTQSRIRRWRRKRQGCCTECGFDVRGSVWSANCPECGALLE